MSRSCSRLSFVRDDKVISPVTTLSASLLRWEGFVRDLNVSNQSEVLSYHVSIDCKCLMSTKQRFDSGIKFKETLSHLKPLLRLGKQLYRPYRKRFSYYRQNPAWKVLGIFRKWQRLKGKELWQAEEKAYMTPPPPDESFFPLSVNATRKLRRQAKLASDKSTGAYCCL